MHTMHFVGLGLKGLILGCARDVLRITNSSDYVMVSIASSNLTH